MRCARKKIAYQLFSEKFTPVFGVHCPVKANSFSCEIIEKEAESLLFVIPTPSPPPPQTHVPYFHIMIYLSIKTFSCAL